MKSSAEDGRALGASRGQLGREGLGSAIGHAWSGDELRCTDASQRPEGACGRGPRLRVDELDRTVQERPDLGGRRGMLHPHGELRTVLDHGGGLKAGSGSPGELVWGSPADEVSTCAGRGSHRDSQAAALRLDEFREALEDLARRQASEDLAPGAGANPEVYLGSVEGREVLLDGSASFLSSASSCVRSWFESWSKLSWINVPSSRLWRA